MLFARGQKSIEKRQGIMLDHDADDPVCCRNCDGVCCRSFPSVELSWDEYRRLQALGATRLQFSLYGPHKLIIENGCEFQLGSRCGIYYERPEVCRRFICKS